MFQMMTKPLILRLLRLAVLNLSTTHYHDTVASFISFHTQHAKRLVYSQLYCPSERQNLIGGETSWFNQDDEGHGQSPKLSMMLVMIQM
ncbi:uncharacterized protein BJ212DRAFT_472871 [Suillus subaureus]|uniref:Secreted protein n=1 Tax=Suillus subaureus TaxID=48587 RepID=A0A9P7DLA5_9AGAM|nr:uncharacterized protein BJ212DRAFT_354669 [Suillus subaureus]XP_041190410.1 uncharacterized protein BJ212DRAFT_472871 [Suillus subaureus]KAG1797645.1 hypothetical protein BJ212DRAFT_354669 [Suillus subaureus]KAG1812128.1 hypothetical protein BJ212DRAFT_472871 [Suillus subaureus]